MFPFSERIILLVHLHSTNSQQHYYMPKWSLSNTRVSFASHSTTSLCLRMPGNTTSLLVSGHIKQQLSPKK